MTSLGTTLDTFPPLFQETLDRVRSRMDADANAGLALDDPRWIDTREGTFYYDITQIAAMEFVRLWDAISVEMPASGIPFYSWGAYLDAHAAIFQLVRKLATPAEGTVRFNTLGNTLVAAGTIIAAPSEDPNASPTEFQTTEQGTSGPRLGAPAGLAATPQTGTGTLPAGTYHYVVTATSTWGETTASSEAAATLTAAGEVALSWTAITGAAGYRVYRSLTSGSGYERLASPTAASFTDDGSGAVTAGAVPPLVDLSAGVDLTVQALIPGTAGNVGATAISALQSPNPGVIAVSNAAAMDGGTEDETDDELRARIQLQLQGAGGGNANSYVVWSLEQPGVNRVFVDPVSGGPGTVLVVAMADQAGGPVASSVVTALQNMLDPTPGQAKGLAPPGAAVTVETTTVEAINVAATITFKAGYSLDGGGGGIAQRQRIMDALNAYINALDVGDTVVYEHVKAQFFTVPGVYTVSAVTVNNAEADVSIPTSPPTIAQLGATTLS